MKNVSTILLLTAATVAFALLLPATADAQEPRSLDEIARGSCDAGAALASSAPSALPVATPVSLGARDDEVGGVQRIENGPCSWCTENSNCSQDCIDNGQQSDCGDYGVCDACREALVEIGRVTVAQRATDPFYFTCEFKWWYMVTYKSVNLSTCQTYTFCEQETETSHSTGYTDACCVYMAGGCFGQTC